MSKTKVEIKSDGPVLEGSLEIPELSHPLPAVLLCHPHPLHGGDMNNKVLRLVGRKLTERGFAVLRFNFRGVGRSQGVHDAGVGEIDDARAAFSFLFSQKEVDNQRAFILGYSFGGMIAFSVAALEEKIKAVVGISPIHTDRVLAGCVKPTLIINGSNDQVVSSVSILKHIKSAGEYHEKKTELKTIEHADHSWRGFEEELGEMTADFFLRIGIPTSH